MLERLENSHPLCSKDRSNPIALAKPSGVTINKTSHEPIPPVSNATHSSPMSRDRTRNARIITPRLPMHLRSRVVTYGERKKVLVSKKKNFENREKNIVKIRNSRELRKKKRPDNYSDDFSIDDDKPLMFFRQKSLSLKKDASMKQRKINNKRPKSGNERVLYMFVNIFFLFHCYEVSNTIRLYFFQLKTPSQNLEIRLKLYDLA